MDNEAFQDLMMAHHNDPDVADNIILEHVFHGENEDTVYGGM